MFIDRKIFLDTRLGIQAWLLMRDILPLRPPQISAYDPNMEISRNEKAPELNLRGQITFLLDSILLKFEVKLGKNAWRNFRHFMSTNQGGFCPSH
jgi:hypothetical protein